MSHRVAFVWDDDLRHYDFGPGHPLAPVRVQLAYRLSRDFGLIDDPNLTLIRPAPLPAGLLDRVHTSEFVAAVKAEVAKILEGLPAPVLPDEGGPKDRTPGRGMRRGSEKGGGDAREE